MRFLKNVLSSTIGVFLALGFLIFLFVGLIAIVISDKQEQRVFVEDNSVLKILLDQRIKDYVPKHSDPFDEIFGENEFYLSLDRINIAIQKAIFDDKIKGISIELRNVNAGLSQLKELRDNLFTFKKHKWITAYADTYGQKEYYLSSVADSVFVHPMGGVDLRGLHSEVLFFKDFQDKYGLKMEVIRHGKYKSAAEPFIANKISENNKQQITELLQSIWKTMTSDISFDRKMKVSTLNDLADNLAGRNATLALKNYLVDGIVYEDEYEEKLKQRINHKHLNTISLHDYIKAGNSRTYVSTKNRIAVVYAQGDIIYGEGDEKNIGQDLMLGTFEKIRKDTLIKAVVLRVNSPGGSALGSDLICRGVERLKAEKPVVVSMGDVAASGGYYIACSANYIFAQPTTITGSIGVFGMLPNASKFTKSIGIHSHRIATNKGAYYSFLEPVKKDFIKVARQSVDDVYQRFVGKVAQGRGLEISQVEENAQGRVWSGYQAVANKLVDSLGGLEQAIEKAAKMANIQKYRIINLPKYKKDFKKLMQKLSFLDAKKEILKDVIGTPYAGLIQKIEHNINQKGIQARLPFVMKID